MDPEIYAKASQPSKWNASLWCLLVSGSYAMACCEHEQASSTGAKKAERETCSANCSRSLRAYCRMPAHSACSCGTMRSHRQTPGRHWKCQRCHSDHAAKARNRKRGPSGRAKQTHPSTSCTAQWGSVRTAQRNPRETIRIYVSVLQWGCQEPSVQWQNRASQCLRTPISRAKWPSRASAAWACLPALRNHHSQLEGQRTSAKQTPHTKRESVPPKWMGCQKLRDKRASWQNHDRFSTCSGVIFTVKRCV